MDHLEFYWTTVFAEISKDEVCQAQKTCEDVIADYASNDCITRVRLNMIAYDQD